MVALTAGIWSPVQGALRQEGHTRPEAKCFRQVQGLHCRSPSRKGPTCRQLKACRIKGAGDALYRNCSNVADDLDGGRGRSMVFYLFHEGIFILHRLF